MGWVSIFKQAELQDALASLGRHAHRLPVHRLRQPFRERPELESAGWLPRLPSTNWSMWTNGSRAKGPTPLGRRNPSPAGAIQRFGPAGMKRFDPALRLRPLDLAGLALFAAGGPGRGGTRPPSGEPGAGIPWSASGAWPPGWEARLNCGRRAAGVAAWLLAVGPGWLAWWLRPAAPSLSTRFFSISPSAPAVWGTTPPRYGAARRRRPRRSKAAGGLDGFRDTAALDAVRVARAASNRCWKTATTPCSAPSSGLPCWAAWGAALSPGQYAGRHAGYRKNSRFLAFGWAAARCDDGLNWPAARLTALTYALLGRTRRALACWQTQAPGWKAPTPAR